MNSLILTIVLIVLGLFGLDNRIEYSGWILFVGLMYAAFHDFDEKPQESPKDQ